MPSAPWFVSRTQLAVPLSLECQLSYKFLGLIDERAARQRPLGFSAAGFSPHPVPQGLVPPPCQLSALWPRPSGSSRCRSPTLPVRALGAAWEAGGTLSRRRPADGPRPTRDVGALWWSCHLVCDVNSRRDTDG